MKPFNLEAAKLGKPVVCRDGTPAKFIAHVPEARSVDAVVVLIDGCIETRPVNGVNSEYSGRDLLMVVPVKYTVWINIYPKSGSVVGPAMWHLTRELADDCASPNRIGGKAWPIEIEE